MTDHPPVRPDGASAPTPSFLNNDATQGQAPPLRKKSSLAREVIETALLALIIFVAVRAVVLNFKVDGLSMVPSFENGEMLLVNRNAYREMDGWDFIDWIPGVDERNGDPLFDFGKPERGDVVVFKPLAPGQDKPYIKRTIGLPGDQVSIRDDGVYVNGVVLDEPYLEGRTTNCRTGKPEYCDDFTVPEGTVFVLGDNRNNSEDSRYFGPVPEDRIIGKAWLTYFPVGLFGTVPHHDYPELRGVPQP